MSKFGCSLREIDSVLLALYVAPAQQHASSLAHTFAEVIASLIGQAKNKADMKTILLAASLSIAFTAPVDSHEKTVKAMVGLCENGTYNKKPGESCCDWTQCDTSCCAGSSGGCTSEDGTCSSNVPPNPPAPIARIKKSPLGAPCTYWDDCETSCCKSGDSCISTSGICGEAASDGS